MDSGCIGETFLSNDIRKFRRIARALTDTIDIQNDLDKS